MNITITDESWFKTTDFEIVRKFGIHVLGISPDKFASKQVDNFKRAMVRQTFVKNHKYGDSFEIPEEQAPARIDNPFGVPKTRKSSRAAPDLKGTYIFVKYGLRAAEGDIRHEIMKNLQDHTSFESASETWHKTHARGEKYKVPNGKLLFTYEGQVRWAFDHNWVKEEE